MYSIVQFIIRIFVFFYIYSTRTVIRKLNRCLLYIGSYYERWFKPESISGLNIDGIVAKAFLSALLSLELKQIENPT